MENQISLPAEIVFKKAHRKLNKYICGIIAGIAVFNEWMHIQIEANDHLIVLLIMAAQYAIAIYIMQLCNSMISKILDFGLLRISNDNYTLFTRVVGEYMQGYIKSIAIRELNDKEKDLYRRGTMAIDICTYNLEFTYYAREVDRRYIGIEKNFDVK